MPNIPIKNFWKAGASLLLLCAYLFVAYAASRHQAYYDPYSLSGNDKISFEKAKVVSVESEEAKKDEKHPGLLIGSQNITVRLLTGGRKGSTFPVINNLNYDTNYYVKPGQTVIVSVSETGDGKTINVNVNSPDRTPFLYLLAGIFVLLLCWAGGRSGFKSVLAIGFTVTSTVFVFIPLLYIGVAPAAAALIFAAVTACVTLFLVGGFEWKSLVAILGTVGGVAAASGIEALFGMLTRTSGYTFADTDSLLAISSHSGLKVGSLFFAAVLISSLGAVMDIAISVAAAVNEIHARDPQADGKALFASGMNVGRDMLGTMANTLILAFTGSSLVMLVQIYTYNMPYFQVMNSNSITAEILQALTGSTAVVLTAPLVSLLSAKLLPLLGKGRDRGEPDGL
ncbi:MULTISPECIES: YibE/F family protein [Acutalibacteraceae]|uniref:YibE/F family protein n=1 Tax=Acutalibacteraceae TaxID=3082771 RepID=UPI0013E89A48|nr:MULTISPECIES: YibE/F family protein [Acutalibacteraceae]